jgi:hypothetical protein
MDQVLQQLLRRERQRAMGIALDGEPDQEGGPGGWRSDPVTGPADRTTHDPYCPKSFPEKGFVDAETGDTWVLGPRKFLCQCEALAAAREIGRGGVALNWAYVRRQLGAVTDVEPGDTARIEALQRVIDLAQRVIRDDDLWDWLRAPNQDLDDRSPLDLVADGREQHVLNLLTSLAEGDTG